MNHLIYKIINKYPILVIKIILKVIEVRKWSNLGILLLSQKRYNWFFFGMKLHWDAMYELSKAAHI